jgi:hypothetical protein
MGHLSFSLSCMDELKTKNSCRNVEFISDMKFRFGWGKIGNNRIADYLYLTTFRQ